MTGPVGWVALAETGMALGAPPLATTALATGGLATAALGTALAGRFALGVWFAACWFCWPEQPAKESRPTAATVSPSLRERCEWNILHLLKIAQWTGRRWPGEPLRRIRVRNTPVTVVSLELEAIVPRFAKPIGGHQERVSIREPAQGTAPWYNG